MGSAVENKTKKTFGDRFNGELLLFIPYIIERKKQYIIQNQIIVLLSGSRARATRCFVHSFGCEYPRRIGERARVLIDRVPTMCTTYALTRTTGTYTGCPVNRRPNSDRTF